MITIILVTFIFCFILERTIPGWPLPKVRTWPFRVLMVNLVQLAVVILAGFSWEKWFTSSSLFHLSDVLSPSGGGVLATLLQPLYSIGGTVGDTNQIFFGRFFIRYIIVHVA